MSYDDEIVKVCKLENGFEVEIYDPSPKKDKKDVMPYQSGWRSFAFQSEKDVLKFLGEKLGGLKGRNHDEEYAAAFEAGIASSSKHSK